MATFLQYMEAAMKRAQVEQMEDGEWYASIPGLAGLWAVGASAQEARAQLHDALDGWIYVNATVGKNRLPDIGGVSLHTPAEKVKDA
jgi:predicted RNase H-like HicB family nuclease